MLRAAVSPLLLLPALLRSIPLSLQARQAEKETELSAEERGRSSTPPVPLPICPSSSSLFFSWRGIIPQQDLET